MIGCASTKTLTANTSLRSSGVNTSLGRPNATVFPSFINKTLSENSAARLISWVTTRADVSRLSQRFLTKDKIVAWWARSRFAVGSSSSSTAASVTNALASTARWRSPPESSFIRRPLSSSNSVSRSTFRAASRSCSVSQPHPGAAQANRPERTNSKTVTGKRSSASCATTAIRLAIARRECNLIGSPSSRISPAVGSIPPFRVRNSVDLPAPFGPMIAVIRRGFQRKRNFGRPPPVVHS